MKVFAFSIALTLFALAISAQEDKEPAIDEPRNQNPHGLLTVPWLPRPWLPVPWPKPWPDAARIEQPFPPNPTGSPNVEVIDQTA